MAVRSALHAAAAALSELLPWAAPVADQRALPCCCGHQAYSRELRSKSVLTAAGRVNVSRAYYLCGHCHRGQFPADAELDIAPTEYSPGGCAVGRRRWARRFPVGHGRRQLELLAGLELTAQAVEWTAEGIAEDIAAREQTEIQRALQLELPLVAGEPVPILYIEMDGAGTPVAPPALRLTDVRTHLQRREVPQHVVAVIALAGHHFLQSARRQLLVRLRVLRNRGDLLGGGGDRLGHGARVA